MFVYNMQKFTTEKTFQERASLVDEICDYLRESIVGLRIKPGEQLNELKLIENLGVSRSPLREAFRLLEGEGLIVRQSRKGVFVREISANDVLELFPIRAALERLAAELAAPRLTKKELQNLERITERMEQAIQRKNIKAYGMLNFEFHRQIVKGARNQRLEEMIKNAGKQWMWLFFATLYFKNSPDIAMSSHRDIYLALNERDGKKAGACIENHIKEGGMRLLGFFPLNEDDPGERRKSWTRRPIRKDNPA